ncbi:MAG: glycerophosphodiester phosphodiesterase, partial [Fusobacterium periodonticum]|nr:glycerophosphodiester phosphodiesterase [Fusobacterium periodonticum]
MKVFAHRGASGYAPENTLVAIKKAIEMKADGIEIDI